MRRAAVERDRFDARGAPAAGSCRPASRTRRAIFMPTKRFSTRSMRPMPLSRPSSLSLASSVAGDSCLPSMATASPFAKPIVIVGRLVGRLLGRDGALSRRSPAPRSPGSSSTLPSEEECSRLASTENGASPRLSLAIGIWCCSANSISCSRLLKSHSRQGAMILMSGFERVVAELEAHLVVALAGGAVADGVGAGLARRSRSASWRSAAGRSRCRADRRPRTGRWRGTSGTRSRARTPRAGPR